MNLLDKAGVTIAGISDIAVALSDAETQTEKQQDLWENSGLAAYVMERYQRAKKARYTDEIRWLKAFLNYRGRYGDEVQFREDEKSRVFVKVTKTKVNAAYGQICDTLFAGNKFPLTIDPTPVPEGISEAVHIDPQDQTPDEEPQMQDVYGYPGDGKDFAPGATHHSLQLGPLAGKLEGLPVKEGPGLTPSAVTFEPALYAAKKMEKKIHDQLDESAAKKHLQAAAFENVLFGEGIVRGPFAVDKEYPRWTPEGEYEPVIKTVPKVSHVAIWNFYPDPDGRSMDDIEWSVERHKLSKTQFRALKKRPHFRKEVIEDCIDMGFNYVKEWWEDKLTENENEGVVERYEALEYWGTIDREIAEQAELDIPKQFKEFDEIQVNVWVCHGRVIRCVLNPFKPNRIPYHAVPFELNPYSFFGIGMADNCEDTQTLLNGFWRLAVDNAVLSSNIILEIDENALAPGQDTRIFPGKQFKRISGAPGQAIYATSFPNITPQIFQMVDKARQYMDEATGQPSYSYGQTGVSGTTRTASGMSMLMGAATIPTKNVVANYDQFLLRPLGEAFFAFNMQFNFDPECVGDLEIKARGVESLMLNEVRSQRLLTFLQTAGSHPLLQASVNADYIAREIARSLDLDPDKVCNSKAEAMRQAMLIQMAQGAPAGGSAPGAPAGAQAADPTGAGGGNMGTGGAPMPGEQGFSANNGSGNGAGEP